MFNCGYGQKTLILLFWKESPVSVKDKGSLQDRGVLM